MQKNISGLILLFIICFATNCSDNEDRDLNLLEALPNEESREIPFVQSRTADQVAEDLSHIYFDKEGIYVFSNRREFSSMDIQRMEIILSSLEDIENFDEKLNAFAKVFSQYLRDRRVANLSSSKKLEVYSVIYKEWQLYVRGSSHNPVTAIIIPAFFPDYHLRKYFSE